MEAAQKVTDLEKAPRVPDTMDHLEVEDWAAQAPEKGGHWMQGGVEIRLHGLQVKPFCGYVWAGLIHLVWGVAMSMDFYFFMNPERAPYERGSACEALVRLISAVGFCCCSIVHTHRWLGAHKMWMSGLLIWTNAAWLVITMFLMGSAQQEAGLTKPDPALFGVVSLACVIILPLDLCYMLIGMAFAFRARCGQEK